MANCERITEFLKTRIITPAVDFLTGLRLVDEVSREQFRVICYGIKEKIKESKAP